MKIALIILEADPALGGAERYTVDLANALCQRHHEVCVLASSFGQNFAGEIQPVRMEVGGGGRLARYRRFLDSVDAHLNQTRYDVVHAMLPVRRCDVYHPHAGIAAETMVGGAWSSRLVNRFNRKRILTAQVERNLLETDRPPVVLCLSNYIRGTLARHYPGLGWDRQVVLHNGIDLRRFDPGIGPEAGLNLRKRLGLAAEQVVGLMLAQDFQRKGLRQTVEAVARMAEPRPVILVAGRDDPVNYQQLAGRLGVADRFHFVGPTDDPYSFYRAADFFVLPTRHDPCSLVVLEALAMGVPVISSIFNGACEVMENGLHGTVLSDPQDIGALAQAMSAMMDRTHLTQLQRNISSLRPGLSDDAHVHALEQIYGQIDRPCQIPAAAK